MSLFRSLLMDKKLSGVANGHEWVDLGLPSGTKWAMCNIGAYSDLGYESYREIGDYFAWGEILPKSNYTWATYRHCNETENTLTKYCKDTDSNLGTVDNKIELELIDDAAYMNWGEGWRMPSNEQWVELIRNCTWTYIDFHQIFKGIGPNGKEIYIKHLTGEMDGTTKSSFNYYAFYWARNMNSHPSSLSTSAMNMLALVLYGNPSISTGGNKRYVGLPIRPIYVK